MSETHAVPPFAAVVAAQAPAPVVNAFTADEIAGLEAQFKRVGRIPSADGAFEFVIRPAQKAEWRMFRGSAHNEDAVSDAQETLITQCVVAVAYEGEKAFDKDAARALFARLLSDWCAVCDDKKVSDMIKAMNANVGQRSPKP